MSHPVRVRGLKPVTDKLSKIKIIVAPRAGAWIETSISFDDGNVPSVAPRAGAWIETFFETPSP